MIGLDPASPKSPPAICSTPFGRTAAECVFRNLQWQSRRMTLIFSHISPITGLFAASDILTSVPTREDPIAVQIPYREKPIAHSNGQDAVAGLAQKTIIFGRTMVSWAGSRIIARLIISTINKLSIGGKYEVDLRRLILSLELSSREMEDIEIIYHFNGDEPWIERKDWNGKRPIVANAPGIIAGGSGIWNFFENMVVSGIAVLPPYEEVLGQLLLKISSHAFAEHAGVETLHYMYGGWFEIAHRSEDGFVKISYGVKLWTRKGGVLASGGPGYINWYRNGNLNITTIQIREINGEERITQKNLIVPDMLGRGPSGPPEADVRPTFMMHIVHDFDHGYQTSLISHDEDDCSALGVGPKGVSASLSPDLRNRLLKQEPRLGGHEINQVY
jgi:hypothetical protein